MNIITLDWIAILQGVAVLLIVWLIRGVSQINGRIGRIEEWRSWHEQKHSETYKDHEKLHDRIRDSIVKLFEK